MVEEPGVEFESGNELRGEDPKNSNSIGVACCVVTIVLSWYSIFKEEFTSNN
jgi:hypothetical protein